MIAFDLDQQLAVAANHICRHMQQQQPAALDPGCSQPFGQRRRRMQSSRLKAIRPVWNKASLARKSLVRMPVAA